MASSSQKWATWCESTSVLLVCMNTWSSCLGWEAQEEHKELEAFCQPGWKVATAVSKCFLLCAHTVSDIQAECWQAAVAWRTSWMICIKSLWFPLKAEVAKKSSEEACLILLLLIYSVGLVATRRRISALCYWFWICSWFKELEVSSVQAINLFPGPCIHASSDRQSSLRVEWISFLPALNVSTINEGYFCFGGKTHPKTPWQVCLCQILTQILSETEEQLENSAMVLQLPEEKCRSKKKAPSVQQCAQHLFLVSALIFQSLPAWAASECVWDDLHGKAVV